MPLRLDAAAADFQTRFQAYLDTGRAWVAAGAPIAGPERAPEVALRFVAAAAGDIRDETCRHRRVRLGLQLVKAHRERRQAAA